MKDRRQPQSVSTTEEFLQDLVEDLLRVVGGFTLLPQRLALVPDPGRRQAAPGTTRRTPPARTRLWPLLLGVVLVTAMPAWAAHPTLPAGVPNVYDPEVRAHFQPVEVGDLRDNPDFPVLLVVNTTGAQPQALLLGLDARNGTDTWSLTTDPIILLMLFADQTTLQGVYVDAGFVDLGRASGDYAAVDAESLPALPDLLGAVTAPMTGASDGLRGASPTPRGRLEVEGEIRWTSSYGRVMRHGPGFPEARHLVFVELVAGEHPSGGAGPPAAERLCGESGERK